MTGLANCASIQSAVIVEIWDNDTVYVCLSVSILTAIFQVNLG